MTSNMWVLIGFMLIKENYLIVSFLSHLEIPLSIYKHVYYGLWLSIAGQTVFQMFLVNSLTFKGNRDTHLLFITIRVKCQNWPLLIQGRLRLMEQEPPQELHQMRF